MRIAISGSSGFIGKHLTTFFAGQGDTVVPLPHSLFGKEDSKELEVSLSGCDVVINLAGSTINQRWTKASKRNILNSRIEVTRQLVSVINHMPVKPSLFISASAVGIYPDSGVYTESNLSEGRGFLAEVCSRWEDEAQKLSPDVRLAITRFGVVLGKDGGAFPKMLLPFRLFAGGRIASGKQGFSWIHIDDVLRGIQFIITREHLSGIINFVSPEPITNQILTESIAKVLHRPAWIPLPAFIFRLLYGEGEAMITRGQQAYPARLLSAGYIFRYTDIRRALYSLIG